MGFLSRITGWDQQQEAHNAVLANHLVETASAELRCEIVKRLLLIQQQVRAPGAGDGSVILAQLSGQSRIVQVNFIALACNSLGIPPGLNGLCFAAVQNPYRSDNESSLSRIGVALDDLSRRSGRQLSWPGNHVKIDFLTWGGFQPVASAGVTGTVLKIDPNVAADLAFQHLLAAKVRLDALIVVATELAKSIGAKSNHELALATALFFFEQQDLKQSLNSAQMMARLNALQWLQEGAAQPDSVKYFDGQLYALYKGLVDS